MRDLTFMQHSLSLFWQNTDSTRYCKACTLTPLSSDAGHDMHSGLKAESSISNSALYRERRDLCLAIGVVQGPVNREPDRTSLCASGGDITLRLLKPPQAVHVRIRFWLLHAGPNNPFFSPCSHVVTDSPQRR